MKNISLLYALLSIALLLFISSCECDDPTDPDCDNYDPCWDATEPVKASFTMSERYWFANGVKELFVQKDVDTAMINAIEFEAPEGFDKYTWLIGAEIIHDRIFERGGFPRGESTPITLIVEKTPNRLCFPEDDGIDTLTRHLYITGHHRCSTLVQGKFEGYFEHQPNTKRTVEFKICSDRPRGGWGMFAYGLTDDCDSVGIDDLIFRYKEINFWGGGWSSDCGVPFGSAEIAPDDNNAIKIEYVYFDPGPLAGETRKFEGRRVD